MISPISVAAKDSLIENTLIQTRNRPKCDKHIISIEIRHAESMPFLCYRYMKEISGSTLPQGEEGDGGRG